MSNASGMRVDQNMFREGAPTFNAQCHVDARVLASIAKYLNVNEYCITSRTSDLVRYVIETFMVNVVPVEQRVKTTEEALSVMRQMGFSVAQLKENKRLAKRMQFENLMIEGQPSYLPASRTQKKTELTEEEIRQEALKHLGPHFSSGIAGLPEERDVV